MNLREKIEEITEKIVIAAYEDQDRISGLEDELVEVSKNFALYMVGEDEPILPSDEEIGTSAHIEWANLARMEIRKRIEESTK